MFSKIIFWSISGVLLTMSGLMVVYAQQTSTVVIIHPPAPPQICMVRGNTVYCP